MMRCDNCGSFEECLVVDDMGEEVIVLAEYPWEYGEYGTVLCPDCYAEMYRRGWNEDWYREDGWR